MYFMLDFVLVKSRYEEREASDNEQNGKKNPKKS